MPLCCTCGALCWCFLRTIDHHVTAAFLQVQVERLETADKMWDGFIADGGHDVDGYPTEELLLTFMSTMSRTRQRVCLAHRGTRREGGQRSVIKNYVSEMANNLWDVKYPTFAALAPSVQKEYNCTGATRSSAPTRRCTRQPRRR